MMAYNIYLGGIGLPQLEFVEKFENNGVQSVVERSLAGNPIIWEQQVMSGDNVTLRGQENTGMIEEPKLMEIFNLSKVPGSTYELNYYGDIMTVRFRNEEAPVIEAKPIGNHLSGKYNNIVIKLMEV